MPFNQEMIDEMNILVKFRSCSSLEGIKVHKSASPAAIAATERLFEKGFLTKHDGGFLTPLGQEAAELIQSTHTMLNTSQQEHETGAKTAEAFN